jgi:transmembrane sensor
MLITMNEEINPHASELISKYLAGEATPDEAMQLHAWMNDNNNKQEYDKLAQLWKHLPNAAAEQLPVIEKEWNELNKKIQRPQGTIIRKLLSKQMAVAASIIGLLVVVSYLLFNAGGNNNNVAQINKQEDIIKSSADAVLTDTLPDGSVIIINKHSSIAFSNDFKKVNRELLLNGEAYFNVVPDKAKPFVISIDALKIEVVGTSFNVRNNASTGNIEVQVQSGIVKMYTTQNEITVVKGQTGTFGKQDGQLKVTNSIDLNSISYATKSFYFNDISFVDACHYLERAFNVVIKIDEQKFSACRLSAEFNNKSLDYILDIISATFNSSYKKDANRIYINGQGCK